MVYINGEKKDPGTGFDSTLNDFLPKFEYIHTKQYYDAVARFNQKTPVGIMLSEVLNTILEENEQYQKFLDTFRKLFDDEDSEIRKEFDKLGSKVQGHLERQFPDCTKVSFKVGHPAFTDLLKNFETTLDDGVLTTAEEKGDGMQRALMLAIIQAYAEYRRERSQASKSFLFFIDEAELHLHPSAQRNLKEVLLELGCGADQVFINTHSSVFVADEHPEQQIFKVEKLDDHSGIEMVDEIMKPNIVFELLGGSPADLLLPRNFLIVEGRTEIEFLRLITKRLYSNRPHIHVVPANGDHHQTEKTINAIEKAFTPLHKSIYHKTAVILCDKPDPGKRASVKEFHRKFPHLKHGQYRELPVGSIEEYYCAPWKKTPEEVSTLKSRQKLRLAKEIGENISKEQFEREMPAVFEALQHSWKLAY